MIKIRVCEMCRDEYWNPIFKKLDQIIDERQLFFDRAMEEDSLKPTPCFGIPCEKRGKHWICEKHLRLFLEKIEKRRTQSSMNSTLTAFFGDNNQ
jgi:hypothetical protein